VKVGERWRQWQGYLHYVDYVVAALIVLTAIYLVVRWWRGRGGDEPSGAEAQRA